MARAHYLAENYIDKNCEDKVAEIYKFEIQRKYENGELALNCGYCYELDSLIWHYEREMQDYDNSRKYLNIFYYLGFKKFLGELMNKKYTYYNDRGNLELNEIQNDLKSIIDSFRPRIYERLILIDNLSNEDIFELFKRTHTYNDLDYELINYIVVIVKKENDTNAILELVEMLKNGYTIDKEEFEDDYYSNFVTTNIATLKELDSQIKVEVDIRNGNINFFLDDDRLETLINRSENKKGGA
ncbi:DNA-binding protein [Staphylococcus gallinarum]|uniref:SAP domain-containing protein n=1 Tax=Staphylococcus gallinarum TaxID=1293 RepID=A0A380S9T7_STAGA|nr:hypothetical protein [Staphylococcus gallinarum]RTX83023.1 DNA-binding protein [Staphylococcus gallinarum]GEQ06568.1 hypothetical protein SGA02_23960 [Staphylococcus gallinarum]SUQ38626.1 SAP domain-containing protein [Staphylococcus gallinarum]